eukprot:jgi/Botrbrau1/5752/Bobra.0134s0025.1
MTTSCNGGDVALVHVNTTECPGCPRPAPAIIIIFTLLTSDPPYFRTRSIRQQQVKCRFTRCPSGQAGRVHPATQPCLPWDSYS